MILFLITLTLITTGGVLCQPKGSISFDNRNVTVIARLNEQANFNQLSYLFQEKAEKWLFGVDSATTIVFDNGELKDKNRFQCKSTVSRCDSLTVLKTSKNELGQYVRSGTAVDNTKLTFTSYYLSAYETPINVKCYSSIGQCRYNQSTNVLSLKENDQVIISCEANFWKSDTTYGIPAEIFYRSSTSDECTSNENKFVLASTDSSSKTQNMQLKKDCSRSFQSSDSGSAYVCGIRYTNSAESLRNDEIDRLSIRIDVHYGPVSLVSSALQFNDFNKTIKQGNTVALKCPFEGNPITYYWKQLNSDSGVEFVAEREFQIPKTLNPGVYQYQCRAYVGGFVEKRTESAVFSINIQQNQATTKIANLPAIIGGSVGGLVLIILVVVLVIYLIKCRQSGFKDDVNKTKENPKPILRKAADKPIYKGASSSNDEEVIKRPLNAAEEGTDPADSEFMPIGNFNQKHPLRVVDERSQVKPSPTPSKRGAAAAATPTVKTYPNINDETKGASDLLNPPTSVVATVSKTPSATSGVYSPSVAEARRADAAAPGANQSRMANNLSASKQNLAIKAGGHKVLPTEDDFISSSKNQNPGESPPSYDAALKQQPNDSPQLLKASGGYQQQTPQRQPPTAQQHYQSQQTLLNNGNTLNSNLKLQQQYGGSQTGSQTKLLGGASSNKNLNMNPSGAYIIQQPQYQAPNLSNPQLNKGVEYSDVVNINRARNRDPIPFNEQQQQQQQTQYSSVVTISKPSIV